MKKQLLLSAAALVMFNAAAFEVSLDGTVFQIDTVYSHVVGPGITQNCYRLKTDNRNFNVYTSTLSKSDYVEPRVIIGNDKCPVGETVSSMANRHNKTDDCRYLTGVNGDFFVTSSYASMLEWGQAMTGYPLSASVIDGKQASPIVLDKSNEEGHLVVSADSWYIDSIEFQYILQNADATASAEASAINFPRGSSQMMVYNSYMGPTTTTDDTDRELVLKLAEGSEWQINGTMQFVVEQDWIAGGSTSIPQDGLVISCGPNYANDMIDNLKVGDTVNLLIDMKLLYHDNLRPDAKQVVAGDVRILNDGEITRSAYRWINTPTDNYQRGLVGFNEAKDTMIIAAVDGQGLTYYESAAFMQALGCYNALDLDGGGSVTMWSNAFGVYNSPRDGAERAIANALYFALKAPVDNEVTSLRFADWRVSMPLYGRYEPVIYGYNQYGELVDTDVKGFSLSIADDCGRIEDETALVAIRSGEYVLTASKDGMTANVVVSIEGNVDVYAKYTSLLIDNYHPTPVQLLAKVDGKEKDVAGSAFDWSSDNEDVVSVDAKGILTGHVNGTATITATNGETQLTVAVEVQCPTAAAISLSPDSDVDAWSVSGSGVTINSFELAESMMNLDFTVTQARAPKITLHRDVMLYSRPDAIELSISPSNAEISTITIRMTLNDGQTTSCTVRDIPTDEQALLRFNISDFTDADDPGIYPITFKSMVVALNAAKGDYSKTFDRVDVVYDSFVDGVEPVSIDAMPVLRVAVDGSAIILPYVVDSIELYDLRGIVVAKSAATNTIDAPSTGLYIVKAVKDGTRLQTKAVVR